MAGLLYRKILMAILALAICQGVFAYESNFPFPFEFGHSSDIYLDVKKPETKQTRTKNYEAEELLKERGIKNSPDDFVKYIKKNDAGAIKLLLEAGFDPNMNINADFPIYYAARHKKRQIVYILLEYGADPNKGFSSPLRCAILDKDFDLAKALIDKGANINFIDVLTDETILYTALKKRQYDIVQLLIKKNVMMDSSSYRLIKKRKLERKLGTYLD